ncbi:MAG: hypothetical protein DMG07_00740, partial [Acidobacteria bacterium]
REHGASRAAPLFEEVLPRAISPPRAPEESLAERVASLPPKERRRALLEEVRRLAAATLEIEPASSLDERTPLQELGLDSLMAMDLAKALSERARLTLAPTLVFNHPSVEALASVLARELLSDGRAEPVLRAAQALEADDAFETLSQNELEQALDRALERVERKE